MVASVKISIWEKNEYIITIDGKIIGSCLSKDEAEVIKKWLPSAMKELKERG